jgi:hypothetical protein
MFNYIEGILKRFSARQRILVLILILSTIISVNAVPRIITAMTYDNEELTKKVETQAFINDNLNKDVINLNKEIEVLNTTIRTNQMDCTNQILNREKEILGQLSVLEQRIVNSAPVKMESINDKSVKYEVEEDVMGVQALKGIQSIKLGLQKSIDGKK